MKTRLWVYPWDILDEGPDVVMDRVAKAGIDEVSVSVLYHGGMLLLPHNPRHKVYFPEDGVAYFVPDRKWYPDPELRPRRSKLAQYGNPLLQICEAATERGLTTVAWVSCLHNDGFGLRHPSLTLENAFGDRYPYALCPSQLQVGKFLEGVVSDLSGNYALAGIELEALYHQRYPHEWSHPKEGAHRTALGADLLSLCFCRACLSAAAEYGVDGHAVRRAVRSLLDNQLAEGLGAVRDAEGTCSADELDTWVPGGAAYLGVRGRVVTELLERLYAASRVPVYGIVGSGLLGRELWSGIALDEWARRCDALTVNCYLPGACATVEEEIDAARRRVPRSALYIGLQSTWPHVKSVAQLTRRIAAAGAVRADGVAFYNYGLMPLGHLDWVKAAIRGTGDA